jgi:uncharacterized protein DUF4384
MISAWLNALAFIVASSDSTAAPRAVVRSPDVAVRVTLSSDGDYNQGDRAKVRVRLADDGYLVVLRADVDGRVRVLFPLDPGDDDFVRGGKDYELRGRGDRETFAVDDRDGTGTVLAARSESPFHYDRFVRGDHWDYRVLASDRVRDDPEAGLLDLVTEMADSTHFDYDVATYTVGTVGYRRYAGYYDPYYGYGSGVGFRFVFGRPYRYCDPFLYDSFFCDSYFYDPFYYGTYRGYYGPYGYSCFPFCYGYRRPIYAGGRGSGGFTFKRPAPPPPFILPRARTPLRNAGVATRPPESGFDWRRVPQIDPRRRPSTEGTRGGSEGRRAAPAGEPRSRGGDWSRPRSAGGERSASPSRGSSSRGSSSRGSSPSRGSGSRPSNSGGGRRH